MGSDRGRGPLATVDGERHALVYRYPADGEVAGKAVVIAWPAAP